MILNLMMISDYYILKMELIGEQRKPRFSQVARALLLRDLPPGQKKAERRIHRSPSELLPTLPAPKIFLLPDIPLSVHSRASDDMTSTKVAVMPPWRVPIVLACCSSTFISQTSFPGAAETRVT